MQPETAARWQRLGELLIQRRIELAPRYRERTVFAKETGLDWRMLHDIEQAKRDTFKAETLAAIEVAYQWQPGSVQRVLDGGDPLPSLAASAGEGDNPWPSFTPEERRLALLFIETLRRSAAEREHRGRESA